MSTVHTSHSTDDGPARENRGRRRRIGLALGSALAAVGTLAGVLSLLRDYYDWHAPSPVATPSRSAPLDPGPPSTGPTGAPATTGGPGGVRLDTLRPEAGEANLVELPRALRGRPGYDHAITIACPSNQSTDQQREVTYPLRRHYLDLTAAVRLYSPDDPAAIAGVTVLVVVQQGDGTKNRPERAVQAARTDAAAGLSADVAGADGLILRVQCESPHGSVILTDARLTQG